MKRLMDLCLAVGSSVFLIIPFLLIFIIQKLTFKGPAIFWSQRIGKNNDLFMMPKFRTMYLNTPQVATHLLQESNNNITPFGKFLRKTSLDEIPQLWSILIGDMSFVGPRPALFNQDDLKMMRTEVDIHKLTPGLTGWAQINGRDEISLEDKVALDLEYVQNKSFFFDIKIIILTFYRVIQSSNVSH